MTYSSAESEQLLAIACTAITHGLRGEKFKLRAADYPAELREKRATFVTLTIDGALRGCIGTLTAHQPLIEDVAEHAHSAAFHDPRFSPLTPDEFPRVAVSISILGAAQIMHVKNEDDLLQQLKAGVDGLILAEGRRQATFLPSVWEDLPAPRDFVRHLKRKAGLVDDYWSDAIRVSRYGVEKVG